MGNIWDKSGKLIGSTHKSGNATNVYDNHNQPLGTVTKTGTYQKSGNKVSSTKDAGLLFGRK